MWPERRATYEAAHPDVPRSKELQKIQKSHKKATVEVSSKTVGEIPNLKITFDAQPA